MSGTCSTYGELINTYKILVKRPEVRPSLNGRIILVCVVGKQIEFVDWLQVTQNRVQWWFF
jgi:hypothetical protein